MKNSILIILMIIFLVVLGCTFPIEVSEKKDTGSTPASEQKKDSEETERLKEKIADLEKKKMEEKIEDLEKKIEDQKNQKTTTRTVTRTVRRPPKGFVRVNSPRDGFLALRSEPSVNRGVRIIKVPHNSTLRLYSCGPVTRVSGRRGRWCQTEYLDNIGYIFDAYVVR